MLQRIIEVLAFIAIAFAMAVFILEAAYGCGQYFTDANGVRHLGECIWLK